jgi:hypothetical protein
MEQPNFRPAHRERLYDTDGQRVVGPAQGTGSGSGQNGGQGREAPGYGAAPGDFRHGGLGVRGHVAEAPHLGTPGPAGSGRPAADAGRFQGGGDFGGGFQAWGHVPEVPEGQRSAGTQADEDFDPDYLQWREEQLRQLDEDYRAWRQHKFAEDFRQWRTRSSGGAG